jgi:cysteine desulfurase
MGLPQQRARASIRLSLGKQTTTEDVNFAAGLVPEMVDRLREISPLYHKQTVG